MARRKRPDGPTIPQGLIQHQGDELEPEADYEAVSFSGIDFAVLDAPNVRFLGCVLDRCGLDGSALPRSMLRDVSIEHLRAVGTDLSATAWIDVAVKDSLLAGTQVFDANLRRVTFVDCKLDSLNLRGGTLVDTRFERCVLTDVDFAGASMERVRFTECRLTGTDFSGAKLEDVDLRGSELGIARGFDALAGAVISSEQLVALAPDLAQHLGIVVRD